jgi:hypothetical protein
VIEVGEQAALEHRAALADVELPERRAPLGQRIAAPHVVDQHVEAPFVALDAGHERLDLDRVGVVDAHGDAAAAQVAHELGGLLDRFGAAAQIERARVGWA